MDLWLARGREGGVVVYAADHRGKEWRSSIIAAHRFREEVPAARAAKYRSGAAVRLEDAQRDELARWSDGTATGVDASAAPTTAS